MVHLFFIEREKICGRYFARKKGRMQKKGDFPAQNHHCVKKQEKGSGINRCLMGLLF
jgi:hypothetical protein